MAINGDKGYLQGNDQCIEMRPQDTDNSEVNLKIPATETGVLTFYYKRDANYMDQLDVNTRFRLNVDGTNVVDNIAEECGKWHRYQIRIRDVRSCIELSVGQYAEYNYFVRLDGISWVPDRLAVGVTFRRNDGTPAPADIVTNVTLDAGKPIGALPVLADEDWLGWSTTAGGAAIDATWIVPATDTQLYALWTTSEHPVPSPEDAPTISGFAAAADGFSLSCTSDNRFDYRLLSTLSLVAPIVWTPTGEPKQGTGEALNFTIPVESTDPMKFFRVEVLQRGTK